MLEGACRDEKSRVRCVNCGSLETHRNGKTKEQKQRYRCRDCGRIFVCLHRYIKRAGQRRWFKKYVEGYTLKQLVEISGLSKSTIRRIVERELAKPVPKIVGLEHVKHVVFDGKYLFRSTSCLLMIFDAKTRRPVSGRLAQRESKPQIQPYLEELKASGFTPSSVTTDGNHGAIAAFKAVWPNITTQRCLFHIERQVLSWCRMKPQYSSAKELKEIVRGLTSIRTKNQAEIFNRNFSELKIRHQKELDSFDPNHKVQGDILAAYSVISNASENMFCYVKNPEITHTTNIVESYFKQIQNIRGFRHNGQTKHHLTQLINWKIHYDTKQEKPPSKTNTL